MALTEENVGHLPSDGSSFFSPGSSESSVIASPAVRLQEAKQLTCRIMRCLDCSREGRRILLSDELYMAVQDAIRLGDSTIHLQGIENLDYWEAKARFCREKLDVVYRDREGFWHPFMSVEIDPEGSEAKEQAEINRIRYRWARKKRYIKKWLATSSPDQQVPLDTVHNHDCLSQRLTSPPPSLCPSETSTLPIPREEVEQSADQIPAVFTPESRSPKRSTPPWTMRADIRVRRDVVKHIYARDFQPKPPKSRRVRRKCREIAPPAHKAVGQCRGGVLELRLP
ncbi:hypothetical protein F5X98DRAFT_378207 [Xylaria grammica]|nr:hypothetical protein F5X98DRAFT_378207 [Xylaria grammica]